ncbi:enoyl-CoA hydratase [Thalassobacillus sp. CUG 92003]|uniref:enoyl-CoA hydratase n=1 Tax=Thalassobacillus sp. CUG 92003 TaxID=2736641 RepID=UPI0015E73DFF|nr:enoyl-CoA hydratase [Thalassobacillus sp. CUG 92003]
MSTITYTIDENVATFTIQSPPANALSSTLLSDLAGRLDEIENDSSVKAVVIRGEGKFFSAGADIKEFTSLQNESDYKMLAAKGQRLFDRLERFHIPVIAAIHGAALGGGLELAMACHLRYVTADATLGLPELSLGIIPGFAGTQRLPRYVGAAKAYEMILSAEPITGKEAVEAGLATRYFEGEGELFESAGQFARKASAKSGPSIHKVMQLIPYSHNAQYEEGVSAEGDAFAAIFGTEDAKEGVQAFIEKRKPAFKDQ